MIRRSSNKARSILYEIIHIYPILMSLHFVALFAKKMWSVQNMLTMCAAKCCSTMIAKTIFDLSLTNSPTC